MIEGFEKQTHPLTQKELFLIDPIVRGLQAHVGEDRAITNKQMRLGLEINGHGKVSDARIRKIINHIRAEVLVRNLIATSKGYWIENDPDKVRKYVQSLYDRSSAIRAIADSFKFNTLQRHEDR